MGVARQTGDLGDLSIRRDPAPGDAPNDSVDPFVRRPAIGGFGSLHWQFREEMLWPEPDAFESRMELVFVRTGEQWNQVQKPDSLKD